MKWLLKLVPIKVMIKAMIDYVCNILKSLAKKTTNTLDDKIVEIIRELLKMWSSLIFNPTGVLVKACIRETILKLLDFADSDLRKEVEIKLKDTK